MSAIDDLRNMGYEVTELEADDVLTFHVFGYGLKTYVNPTELQALADDTAAHDARVAQWEAQNTGPTPAEIAEFETIRGNEELIRERLSQGIATINTHISNMEATSPTAAQQRAALLFALKASKNLARLALRALDSAD